MKNLVKYSIVALLFFLIANVYGQTAPNKVTLEKDYYQNGYNSTGGPALSQEVRDSVTVTSTMKYFVLPDATANPDFKYDTPENAADFTKVLSTFSWGFRRNGGSPLELGATTGTPTNKHIISILWGNTAGVDTIRVTENPTNGCPGTETKIPVAVIPKPTITFDKAGSPADYKDGACYTQTQVNAGINHPFELTPTTASSQIKVNYTMVFTPVSGTPETTYGTNVSVPIVSGKGILTIMLKNDAKLHGKYEVTITQVTDRISRKSNAPSTGAGLLTVGGSATFTYSVLKPVETGPIYRLPNNGNY